MTKGTNQKVKSLRYIAQDIVQITFYIALLVWTGLAGITLWGGKDAVSKDAIFFVTYFTGASMLLQMILSGDKFPQPTDDPIFLKFEAFKLSILLSWGKIFRAIFILFLGIVGYCWINPPSMADIPFSELTLRHIFSNLFAWIVAIGCVVWFFKFPKHKNTENPYENPYAIWGTLSVIVFAVSCLTAFLGGIFFKLIGEY